MEQEILFEQEILDETVKLDEVAELGFVFEDSVEEARVILNNLIKRKIMLEGSFEDDDWIYLQTNGYQLTMRFSEFNSPFKVVLKCWCAELCNRIYPQTADSYLYIIRTAMDLTDNFLPGRTEMLREHIAEEWKLSESTKRHYVYALKSFLVYSSIEQSEDYIACLNSIPLSTESNVRQLPKFYDVLTFHDVINHFIKSWTEQEKLLYFPIVLWWKITSIIPMRISEFCRLSRKGIVFTEKGALLTVIRSKNYAQQDETIDTYEISLEISNLIKTYLDISNGYGSTETLISYKMYKNLSMERNKYGRPDTQINIEKFNTMNFNTLLDNFYCKIVEIKYGYKGIERIKPTDTRHFAFCSLMLQGVDPLTIARLGGHKKLESQLHYQRHLDYFVESKIYQITRMNMLKLSNTELFNSPFLLEEYEVRSLISLEKFKHIEETDEGGYCTDAKELRCESTRSCFRCSKYWVSREVLTQKLAELESVDTDLFRSINNRLKIIQRYYNEAYSLIDDGQFNIQANESLQYEVKGLKGDIHDSAMLKTLLLWEKGVQMNW
ncbi:tyrosine-type recombinase/integrase [Paenibacillus sp. NPDC093718]|uniref:tyrosine-type recombinase/integrase n=1 Tax=Paenibacillus sp. NPDC093718 TaxID=3390601 RepID=UPI003CFF687F